jgi:ABC-type cobalamin transport system permease subunit
MINTLVLITFGGKQTRTADVYLAKVALYQLSYTPHGWAILDSNQRPYPYQGYALTS